MTRTRIAAAGVLAVAAVALLVAGLAGAKTSSATGTGAQAQNLAVSGSISFDGIWTASSGQKQFADVIKAFNKIYPNVHVNYKPVGNDLPTVLATAVAGGHPPDMADVAQPGTIQQFVNQGKLKPITYATGVLSQNFAPAWKALGTFNGKLYALPFKAANKSLIWYNVPAFKAAGITPPKTWAQLLTAAKTLKASGTPAYSIGGADGWTLTDLFENLYLRTAGPQKYDQLTKHEIPWTDPSVKTALTDMAQVLSDTGNIYGGTNGALQTDFPTAVGYVLATKPKAAQVIEGDFVPAQLTTVPIKPVTGYNEFTFPAVNGSSPSVVGAGNLVITFNDNPAIDAFVKFLATPAAALPWIKAGGFVSANKKVAASAYTDPILRKAAQDLTHATTFKFDMSDQQPIAFGGTTGQGEWKIFQDFLKNPSNVNGTASALESAAAKAYKSS